MSPNLTARTSILKSTEKMTSEEKVQAKKTGKILSLDWDYCWMRIRFLLA